MMIGATNVVDRAVASVLPQKSASRARQGYGERLKAASEDTAVCNLSYKAMSLNNIESFL